MPAGTLIAGWPVVLKMPVNTLNAAARTIVSGRVVSAHPSAGTRMGSVGVRSRSWSPKNGAISRPARSSACSASITSSPVMARPRS